MSREKNDNYVSEIGYLHCFLRGTRRVPPFKREAGSSAPYIELEFVTLLSNPASWHAVNERWLRPIPIGSVYRHRLYVGGSNEATLEERMKLRRMYHAFLWNSGLVEDIGDEKSNIVCTRTQEPVISPIEVETLAGKQFIVSICKDYDINKKNMSFRAPSNYIWLVGHPECPKATEGGCVRLDKESLEYSA